MSTVRLLHCIREMLPARQPLYKRCRCLHLAVEDHIVRNVEAFSSLKHLLGNLLDRANKDGWHFQKLLNRNTTPTAPLSSLLCSLATIVIKHRRRDDAQLKL